MWSGFPLFPEQASTTAARVDGLYFFLIALTAFFSLLIGLMVLGFAVRYRRRSPDDKPPAIYGSLVLELKGNSLLGIGAAGPTESATLVNVAFGAATSAPKPEPAKPKPAR